MGFPTLWGVKGLNEAEQRGVRGGIVQPKLSRAECIRDLIAGYAANRRQPGSNRAQLLLDLRAAIASCASDSQV